MPIGVLIATLKLLACITMIVFGVYCLNYSIKGKRFYYGHLLRRNPNDRAPGWFARPVFFVMGIFWICAAVVYFRQEFWHLT
jgi:hypothetical protein